MPERTWTVISSLQAQRPASSAMVRGRRLTQPSCTALASSNTTDAHENDGKEILSKLVSEGLIDLERISSDFGLAFYIYTEIFTKPVVVMNTAVRDYYDTIYPLRFIK